MICNLITDHLENDSRVVIKRSWQHLCSLLGRSTSAKDPKKDMNACTDILITVLKGHYVAATCNLLEIDDPEEGKPESLPDFHKMSAR